VIRGRDREPDDAAAPLRSDADEDLMRDMRRLLAGVDRVPAETLLAARMAFALLPDAATAPPAPLTRRRWPRSRMGCAQARRLRRAHPLRRRRRRRRPPR